jgi:TPP-dependent pyruvate/acetoin dehydrogenase alpha subunit
MLEPWKHKDPIDRMRKYLLSRHGWSEEKESQLTGELTAEVEEAVKEYEATPNPQPTDIFNHMYAEMPWHLREQEEEMLRHTGQLTR